MALKKSLFIGNNFLDSQLLYAIPVIHGYCQKKGIKRLVFERPLIKEIANHANINEILINYEVIVDKSYSNLRIIRAIKFFKNSIKVIISAYIISQNVTRKSLLADDSWFKCQLKHAVFDQALQKIEDGTLDLPFKAKLMAGIRVLIAIDRANYLIRDEGVVAAFLGHTVYAGRALLAKLKLKNVDVIAHAINVFYRIPDGRDSSWCLLEPAEWKFLMGDIADKTANEFWRIRCEGNSSYEDARIAAKKSKFVTENTPKNILFLHVFRDSPFNHIDRKRIFSDYIEWIEETLAIIAKSNETWLIKTHPSSLRWGENQQIWLNAICKNSFNNVWPENIEIDQSRYSNMELFRHANRVVTYHGTSHLEAACWGVRPIAISEATLASYDPKLNLKPNNLCDYKKLLLASSESLIFRLSECDKLTAKKLLYIREELLCFTKEVGTIMTYRGDTCGVIKKDFDSVTMHIKSFAPNLIKAGEYMASGLSRTVAIKYLERWCLSSRSSNNS